MTKTEMVAALGQFALENYEEGGHWVYETHEVADYERVLDRVGGSFTKAQKELKELWELREDVRDSYGSF